MRVLPLLGGTFSSMPLWSVDIALRPSYRLKYKKTPWRKESKDLIKCQTYQERFEQVKDEVICNRHQYEYHSEILDKAMEDMNNAECDNCENVAPNAEHVNQQDSRLCY